MRLGCQLHETIVYPARYRDFHTLPAQNTLLMLHTALSLNRDGLETSGENVHNESCSALQWVALYLENHNYPAGNIPLSNFILLT